jgi:hypothetical protein
MTIFEGSLLRKKDCGPISLWYENIVSLGNILIGESVETIG